jgi:hypothetical protein
MPVQLSSPLEGLLRAGQDLEKTARRIAGEQVSRPAETSDTVKISSRAEGGPDYAAEMVNLLKAGTAFKANLKALSATMEAEDEAIKMASDV